MPLDTGSTLGSFATGSVAGYVSTLEKARLEEGKKRSDDVETLKALLSAGWKPLDPKKGSPTGEALVLQSLGQVMIPPLIDKEAEFKLHLETLAAQKEEIKSRERIAQTQERREIIKERSDELDRLAKERLDASAVRRAEISERVAEIDRESKEIGLKSDKITFQIAQFKALEAVGGKSTDIVVDEIDVINPITKEKTKIKVLINKKDNTYIPLTSKTGERALAPVTAKEPTPLGEKGKFDIQKSLAAAKGVVETLTIDGETVKPEQASGYVDLLNTWSPEPFVYRIIPDPHLYGTRWARDPGKKIQRFSLPRLADGTQITAKMLYEVATKMFRTTPDEYLDKLYKNGKLAPGTVWPPKDWPGIVSAVPPVAKPSPPRPPLPIQ